MRLIIDTAQKGLIKLGLTGHSSATLTTNRKVTKQIKVQRAGDSLMAEIVKFLTEQKIKLKDLKGIEVKNNLSPGGSWSGLRSSVAAANALGYALKIKVNGSADLVIPQYDTIEVSPR